MRICQTCSHACIVSPISAECCLHNTFCPKEMTCEDWEQADEILIKENSIDWTKARIIEV